MKPHQRNQNKKKPRCQSAAEDPDRPVFFYMPNEPPYGVFCQWYRTSFDVPLASLAWLCTAHPEASSRTTSTANLDAAQTITFNCAEQFMMYCKAVFFHDPASEAKILASLDPKEQKILGREIQGWDDYLWLSVCERVAFEGNWWKFSGDGEKKKWWRDTLLETRERELCEASTKDKRWGFGYREKDALKYRKNWGANLLGKALMRVRGKLRERMKKIEEGERIDCLVSGYRKE